MLYPYLPTFNPSTQNFLLARLEKKFFLAPFSSENLDFPIRQQCKEKKYAKKKKKKNFPTYLPNQQIQGRGTANKQFFKDGLILPILQPNTGCFPIQKRPVFSHFFPNLRILLGFIPKFKRHRLYPKVGNKFTAGINYSVNFDFVFVCLFVLGFNGPVNNEVMSSRSVNSGTVPGQA